MPEPWTQGPVQDERLLSGATPALPVLELGSWRRMWFRVRGLGAGLALLPICLAWIAARAAGHALGGHAVDGNLGEVVTDVKRSDAKPVAKESSRTAMTINLIRHANDCAGLSQDPCAGKCLNWGMWFVATCLGCLHRVAPARVGALIVGSMSCISVRTLFFDRLVINAVTNPAYECDQVVILGAGFDSRAHRLRSFLRDKTRFFEVDIATTLQHKKRLVAYYPNTFPNLNVVYVGVNFDHERTMDKLVEHGFDPSKRAVFVMEGVIMYLPRHVASAVLRDIAQSTCPGTLLGVDLMEDVWSTEEALATDRYAAGVLRATLCRKDSTGEKMKFGLAHHESVEEFFQPLGVDTLVHLAADQCRDRFLVDPLTGREYERMSDLEHLVIGRVRSSL